MEQTDMNHDPTVSVVIPAYNNAPLLPDTLDSVLGQTYQDFEVVLVDDGSTDATSRVAKQYEGDIRYIRKGNGGSASARNRGVREARGSYIALLDADDLWVETKLERQMMLFEQLPSLKWSYTDWLQIEADTHQVVRRAGNDTHHPDGSVLRALVGALFIPPSTEIIKRSVFEEVGYYDESSLHRISEDWELSLRVASQYPVGYMDEPLTKRPVHPHKKTSTMNLEHALESRLAIVRKAIQRNPEQLAPIREAALANQYANIGRKWLDREERGKARQVLAKALRLCPGRVHTWIYWFATFLPRPILSTLSMLRRKVWKAQMMGQYALIQK